MAGEEDHPPPFSCTLQSFHHTAELDHQAVTRRLHEPAVVYWDSEKRPEYLGIAVGCFADLSFPAPTLSCWEESQHSWLGLPPHTEHLELGLNADDTPMRR